VSVRTIDEIGTDLARRYEEIRLLRERAVPVLLELVRAKVHAFVPDAIEFTLLARTNGPAGSFTPEGGVLSADGTVEAWSEVVDDAIADGETDDDTGGLDDMLLADLAFEFPPSERHDALVIDLVHLKAHLT
jgi:hypothetical protein